MRTEQEIRALVMQVRRYGLQNPDSLMGLHNVAITLTILAWVLNETTMGDVAYAVTGGVLGRISGGATEDEPLDEEVAG